MSDALSTDWLSRVSVYRVAWTGRECYGHPSLRSLADLQGIGEKGEVWGGLSIPGPSPPARESSPKGSETIP